VKELENAKINVLFCNDEEYPLIKKCASRLMDKGTLIVMTRGKNGSVIYSKSGAKEYPGFTIKSVDVTGAGDAFSAGFIYGYMKKWEMPHMVEFASACGAIAVTHYGPREIVPSEKEISEFIRSKRAQKGTVY
ncbi:MAG: carbohydrate kinase family protein, partial [Candidatus Aenigmarchaeota archaeon]|nr:carbohydrate kinase family protein [Candidatus Aenigmarchaeota archaeon]